MTQLSHMRALCRKVLDNAYVPYIVFPVAACIRTPEDQCFVGVNYQNVALPSGLCAEAVAIGNMITAGQTQIQDILVMTYAEKATPPCGGCLQRITEFANDATQIHLCHADREAMVSQPLMAYLPAGMRPNHLETSK